VAIGWTRGVSCCLQSSTMATHRGSLPLLLVLLALIASADPLRADEQLAFTDVPPSFTNATLATFSFSLNTNKGATLIHDHPPKPSPLLLTPPSILLHAQTLNPFRPSALSTCSAVSRACSIAGSTECRLDEAPVWSACSSPHTIHVVSEGEHELSVNDPPISAPP
jgi:hypothetical protein